MGFFHIAYIVFFPSSWLTICNPEDLGAKSDDSLPAKTSPNQASSRWWCFQQMSRPDAGKPLENVHMEIISSGMHLMKPREMLIFPSDCRFCAVENGKAWPSSLTFSLFFSLSLGFAVISLFRLWQSNTMNGGHYKRDFSTSLSRGPTSLEGTE